MPDENLIKDWTKICDNNPNSCASSYPIFALSSIKLLNTKDAIIACAYINNTLTCVIPLRIRKSHVCFMSINILQTLNHDHLDIYTLAGEDLWKTDQLFNQFILALRNYTASWDYFYTQKILSHSKNLKKNAHPFYTSYSAYFNVKKPDPVIPKKLARNINRLEKKLKNNEKCINFKSYSSNDEVPYALNVFLELEDSGWKHNKRSSIVSHKKTLEFYTNIWNHFSTRGNALVYILFLDDTPIAASIAFTHSTSVYLHKIAYQNSLSKFGPGSILIKNIIEECLLDPKIETILFNTNPEWIKRWHPQQYALKAFEGYNNTLKAQTFKFFQKIYYLIKHIKRSCGF